MKKTLKFSIVAGIVITAITTAFAGNAPVKDCGHPCETHQRNVCCTGGYMDSNGDYIAWSKLGIHRVD